MDNKFDGVVEYPDGPRAELTIGGRKMLLSERALAALQEEISKAFDELYRVKKRRSSP